MGQKRIITAMVCLSLAVLCSTSVAGEKKTETGLLSRSFNKKIAVPKRIAYTLKSDYFLYVPKSYAKGKKDFPLVVFLHDEAQRGDSPALLRSVEGPLKEAQKNTNLPYLLVAPQCGGDEEWTGDKKMKILLMVLDEVAEEYRVNKDRVYLVGTGMGGTGVWTMALREPERFAAMIAVNGKGNASDAWKLKKVPTWIYHGEKYKKVGIDHAKELATALTLAAGNVQKTFYPDKGGDISAAVFSEGKAMKWLLKQQRSKDPSVDTSVRDSYKILKGALVDISDPFVKGEGGKQQFTVVVDNKAPAEAKAVIEIGKVKGFGVEPTLLEGVVKPESVSEFKLTLSPEKGSEKAHPQIPLSWSVVYPLENMAPYTLKGEKVVKTSVPHTCSSISHSVSIDGKLDEWKSLPMQIAGTEKSGNEVKFVVAHDKDNLYVAVRVKDDKSVLDPTMVVWEQDGIEIRVDGRNDLERNACRGEGEMDRFVLIAMSPARSADDLMVFFHAERVPDGIKAACVKSGEGFATEVAIPASYLDKMQGKKWEAVRINIAADDNDGPSERNQYWLYPDWRSEENIPGSGTFVRK